ncbi:MAG: YecA family protein [Bacillota bacterium]
MKIGRNAPCPCGSGKKYKKCCLNKQGHEHPPEELEKIKELLKAKKGPEHHLHIVPSIVWNNYRWRVIWNTLYYRPLSETFHEFILNMLRTTFGGEEWRQEQMSLAIKDRHVLIQWDQSCKDWSRINQTEENEVDDKLWSAEPTGEVKALFSLAYDVYCLQVVNKLPEFIIKRLKNKREFQGARYEIAIAAIIARAGFEINFLDDKVKSQVHCEFIAKHKETGIEIGIEAKSRRKKGVLHEEGEFNFNDALKGDIRHLFRKARSQKPADMPYIIFIDLNIPPTPNIPLEVKPWINDIRGILLNYGIPSHSNPDPFNMVFFTNFSFYYGGNEGPVPQGECFVIESEFPQTPLSNAKILNEIEESVKRYAYIPQEV